MLRRHNREHSIGELALYASISNRTLRYYDEIDLLIPKKKSPSGYRLYGEEESEPPATDTLFYRELDFDLETIKTILDDPQFDRTKALVEHMQRLVEKQRHIDALLQTVKKRLKERES